MKIKQDTKDETLDLCFLMDATGSMGSWITQTKANILQIIDDMNKENPNQQIRLAMVAYRDYTDSKLLEVFQFSTKYQDFKNFVGKIQATGGGDGAEDVFSGIDAALKLDWSSKAKMLIHFADAPCHGNKYHTKGYSDNYAELDHKYGLTAENLFEKMIKMEIDFSFMKIQNDTDIMIEEFKKIYDEGSRIILVQEAKLPEKVVQEEKSRMLSEGVSESHIMRKKEKLKKNGWSDDKIKMEECKMRKPSYLSTYVSEELEDLQHQNYQNVVNLSIHSTRQKQGWEK
eukprot:gene2033-1540_t